MEKGGLREYSSDRPFRYPANSRNLLARPEPALLDALDQALAALTKVYPVPAAHRADLPLAVRDLSRILTADRSSGLSRSYWSAPRFLAAYLRYFLPWNLYRLAWLLPGLDLPLKAGAHILDLGSGPLTLPLALWCARPDLRSVPLTISCADIAPQPMNLGRAALHALAGDASPWRVKLVSAPAEKALHTPRDKDFDCIMAGNMLNELCTRSGLTDSALLPRLEKFMVCASSALTRDGRLFLLEPGTRLGGKLIGLARDAALQQGFLPLAPCTHDGPCPMTGRESAETRKGRGRPALSFSGWCHFIHPADLAPKELQELTRSARLEKDSLALSCLLLRRPVPSGTVRENGPAAGTTDNNGKFPDSLDDLEALYAEIMEEDGRKRAATLREFSGDGCRTCGAENLRAPAETMPPASAEGLVRVISAPIRLPDQPNPGRYACCEKGVGLLLDALHVPSGAAVVLPWPVREERDGKTGALLLRLREQRVEREKTRETRKKCPRSLAPRRAGKSSPALAQRTQRPVKKK